MTASRVFFWFCLAFLAGLAIESFLKIPWLFLPGFLIAGIFCISLFWKKKKIVILGLSVLFLVFGISRYQMAETGIVKNDLAKFNDQKEKIVLIGKISKDPKIGEKTSQLIIESENSKILIFTGRYPEYQYGDELEITGFLKSPPALEGFDYPEYLKKEGIYSIMEWPHIKIIGENKGNFLMKVLFSFKNKFKQTTARFIPLPQQGFLEALVFGDETNISREWKEKLNITGTRHIAAVSGMNITIIAFLILNFLLYLGLWRQQALFISIFLLVLYILMIGAPASAVRAGIMGSLLIVAQSLGRMSQAGRAVVFAAFFMLFLNPFLLRIDVGFQLSFLALLGLIYLQPFLSDILKRIPDFKIFPVRTTLSATLAAQVFTMPVLIFNFGYVSLVSIFANVLIVPVLAFLTILIFVFAAAGMIFWPLGWLFSFPVYLFLSYITKTIDFFSRIPFSVLKIENISWLWIFIFYSFLIFAVWRIQKYQKFKFLRI